MESIHTLSLFLFYCNFFLPHLCKFEVILFSYNRANGGVIKNYTGCHVTVTD